MPDTFQSDWSDERKWRYDTLIAYIHSPLFIESLYRQLDYMRNVLAAPGVTFTPEQRTQIQTMVEQGREADARRVILAELNRE